MHFANRRCVLAFVCLAALQASVVWGQASSVIKTAPALPPPAGSVIDVYNVSQFYSAISSTISGVTVMIHPGTYTLSSVPQLNKAGMTIRGSTGNRDDVVLVGSGMNTSSPGSQYGFQINVTSTPAVPMVIADLTISGVYYHGIQIRGENSVSNVLIHNVKILNAGERFIKGSSATGKIAANITIEYCWLEQNQTYVSRPSNPVDPDNYIGGIDAIGLNNWQIHDCVIKNIQGLTGGGRGGIFLWGGVTNSVAERNCIMGCDRDIAFGNPSRSVPYHSTDCIIRNNFVVGGASFALELCASNNLKVYNNTVYCSNSGASAVHVYDGVTTGLKIYSDIIRGQIFLNNAGGTVTADTTGSIVGSSPVASWFVDATNADLRLTSSATAAINQGQVLAEVTNDYFALPRDSQPDKGAYEYVPPPPPHVSGFTPALGHVSNQDAALTTMAVTFDKDATINRAMVSVSGANTGAHNDFAFSYEQRVLHGHADVGSGAAE